jgi:hypothetical protein
MRTSLPVVLFCSSLAVACGVVSVGPAISPERSAVGPRAEAELGCPQDKIEFARIDDKTIIAKGCQKQSTYVRLCSRPGSFGTCGDSQWVKNSETTNTAEAAK